MIEINNLTFGYSKNRLLFHNLGLNLKTGNVYGLLGRNGAGKTTLLKIISGLLYPKSGICNVEGLASQLRIPQLMEDIYIIPEEFYMPSITIDKFISINGVFYKNFSQTDIDRLIREFNLPRDLKLSSMSYGQKKKFLIAFGIATNVKFLILDEPTNGLDIPSKTQFRKVMAASLTEDRCIIISTHQVRDLESVIDTIVILEEGAIIFNQPTEKISQKLVFRNVKAEDPDDNILYYEEVLGGKFAILKNTDNEPETKVELEVLFNGVLSNPKLINEILN